MKTISHISSTTDGTGKQALSDIFLDNILLITPKSLRRIIYISGLIKDGYSLCAEVILFMFSFLSKLFLNMSSI